MLVYQLSYSCLLSWPLFLFCPLDTSATVLIRFCSKKANLNRRGLVTPLYVAQIQLNTGKTSRRVSCSPAVCCRHDFCDYPVRFLAVCCEAFVSGKLHIVSIVSTACFRSSARFVVVVAMALRPLHSLLCHRERKLARGGWLIFLFFVVVVEEAAVSTDDPQ